MSCNPRSGGWNMVVNWEKMMELWDIFLNQSSWGSWTRASTLDNEVQVSTALSKLLAGNIPTLRKPITFLNMRKSVAGIVVCSILIRLIIGDFLTTWYVLVLQSDAGWNSMSHCSKWCPPWKGYLCSLTCSYPETPRSSSYIIHNLLHKQY